MPKKTRESQEGVAEQYVADELLRCEGCGQLRALRPVTGKREDGERWAILLCDDCGPWRNEG